MAGHLFITGGTAGIGAALCRQAVAAGWQVTGCGRRSERLDALAAELGAGFCPAVADVTVTASLEAAVAAGCARFGAIDVLVANAGRGLDGELLDCSASELQAVMDVNLLGVHRSVLATRPAWAADARIVIVSSIVAALAIPRMGAYCATKHAVDAYAASLRMELAASGQRVTSVNPGTVATEFFDQAPQPGQAWTWRPGRPLTAEAVAKRILRHARGRGPRRDFIPARGRWVALIARLLPGLVEAMLRRKLAAMRRDEG